MAREPERGLGMKGIKYFVLLVLLLLSPFSSAGEVEHETPRGGKHFYLGIGVGGTSLFYESEGQNRISPSSVFLFRAGWVATSDLLLGYELFWVLIPLPFTYTEGKHCFLARFYPVGSLPGYYVEGGAGVLTNSIDCGGCYTREIDVSCAFFTRVATGYDFELGSSFQLGLGLKYHTNFYHATPGHEISLVVEINWFPL